MKNNTDIIEVFVKYKLGLKLTEAESKMYFILDDDIKATLNELITCNSFLYDLEEIINKIIKANNCDKEELLNVLDSWKKEKQLKIGKKYE